jgi:hypothetical protein
MSDFETFGGVDASGQVDQASFEKFKERVKQASAQIKAAKAAEQKQRKKEDKLIKILLKFVKNKAKNDIMLLIAKLLEENLPPVFVLSIVLLGNEDILENDEERKMLSPPSKPEDVQNNQSLSLFEESQTLPLEIKIAIDSWMKGILKQAGEFPKKLVKYAFDQEGNLKLPLVQLSAFILRDYLEKNKQETDYERLREFSDLFLNGVLKQIKTQVENQKELKKAN